MTRPEWRADGAGRPDGIRDGGEGRIGAVLLAAGSSRRMGREKLLLPWRGSTVIEATLANLRQAGIPDPLVVTSGRSAAVDAAVTASGARLVQNPDAEAGEMLSSLQRGLRSLPEQREAVLVLLADQPMIGPRVIGAVMRAGSSWTAGSPPTLRQALVVPEHGGSWGHPVLFGRDHVAGLMALPAGSRPRELLLARAERLTVLRMEDAAEIVADLDTVEDYERWEGGGWVGGE